MLKLQFYSVLGKSFENITFNNIKPFTENSAENLKLLHQLNENGYIAFFIKDKNGIGDEESEASLQ